MKISSWYSISEYLTHQQKAPWKRFQSKQHFATTSTRLTKKNYGFSIPQHFFHILDHACSLLDLHLTTYHSNLDFRIIDYIGIRHILPYPSAMKVPFSNVLLQNDHIILFNHVGQLHDPRMCQLFIWAPRANYEYSSMWKLSPRFLGFRWLCSSVNPQPRGGCLPKLVDFLRAMLIWWGFWVLITSRKSHALNIVSSWFWILCTQIKHEASNFFSWCWIIWT